MATSAVAPQIDPNTGERVPPVEIDPSTGERVNHEPAPSQGSTTITPEDGQKAFQAAVYGKMLDTPPSYAYQNLEEVDTQVRQRAGDDFDKGVGYAIKTGFEETPLGLLISGKSPDPFESHSKLGNFIHDVSAMVSDPLAIASAFTSEAGIGLGGFAADAAIRKTLIDQYQKGDVKDFKELADRAGAILWEGAKGAAIGKAGMAAGELPVGSLLEKSVLASAGVKGLYQSAAMTTAGALLNGQLPSVEDFERSASLVVPLNLVSGGAYLRNHKQALMDNYAETGVTPEQASLKVNAQPPVKPDLPEGLRPAIKIGEGVIEGDEGVPHSHVIDSTLGTKPVEMDQLQEDPQLADKVLQNPEIHEQAVIDEAYRLKKDAVEKGEAEPELPERGKSGRGFVTPDGKFLERTQAKAWMKENEPEVHQMWEESIGEDAKAELHSDAYGIARMRVSAQRSVEGEPDYNGMSPELSKFLGNTREELNTIDDLDTRYGRVMTRSLFDGPRKMLRAEGEQVAGRLRKMISDKVDQEGVSFLRDYRDDPQALRSAIEEVRAGSNEKLKAFIPSMERALNPSEAMLKADQEMTEYFTGALDLGRQVGTLDSTIDPARYSPRIFMEAMKDIEAGRTVGKPKLTEKTPHAIQREYLHILDPLMSGEGMEARTFNAVDELGVYADRHATSIATKLFTTELKNSRLAIEGTEENHPDNWVKMTPTSKFYVPKKIADAIKPMIEPGGWESTVAKAVHLQSIVKGIELTLSFFHPKALTFVAMNNMRLDAYTKALTTGNNTPEFEAREQHGALYGLETSKTSLPYESYQGLKPSSLREGFLSKLGDAPVIKQVDQLFKAQTKFIFDGMQRRFKVIDFSTRAQAWEGKNPEATPIEYGKAMRGIAKEVNSAYGGLNWDVMGVSKGMRDLSRLILLAPDWTFSNFLQAGYAFEGGPGGTAARLFWLKSFTTGIAMTQATSIYLTGKKSDDPTQVALGDGKHSNWYFAAAPKDAISLAMKVMNNDALQGLAQFVAGKLGPIAGTTLGLMSNKQYPGGPPITKRSDDQATKTEKDAKFVAGKVVPITVSSIVKLLTDDKDHPWTEYVGAMAGVQPAQGPAEKKTPTPSGPGMSKRSYHLKGVKPPR